MTSRIFALVPAMMFLIPGEPLRAQISDTTRFTIAAAPFLSQPKEEFGNNIGNGFGGEGGVLYHLDRSAKFSLRFDISGLGYGRETMEVPFSETVGGRVLVDTTTRNSIVAFSFGPEVALPVKVVRPYANVAISALLFRTSSSVDGDSSEGPIASTTNFKDSTRAWIFGTGVRIPVPRTQSRLDIDVGIRYHRGGVASYLREGSIEDRPDGTIAFTPLTSRTPYMAYLIGIRFRIPFDSPRPCPRWLC